MTVSYGIKRGAHQSISYKPEPEIGEGKATSKQAPVQQQQSSTPEAKSQATKEVPFSPLAAPTAEEGVPPATVACGPRWICCLSSSKVGVSNSE